MIPCRTTTGGRCRGRTIANGASDHYRRFIRVAVAFATLHAIRFHVQGCGGVTIASAGVQSHGIGIRQHVTELMIHRTRGKGGIAVHRL
jgi:hypothetical protein